VTSAEPLKPQQRQLQQRANSLRRIPHWLPKAVFRSEYCPYGSFLWEIPTLSLMSRECHLR